MFKHFIKLVLTALLLIGSNWPSVEASNIPLSSAKLTSTLTVTQTTSASFYMDWTPFGDGNYTVIITDLDTRTVMHTFTTSVIGGPIGGAIGGALGGLRGHQVRFEVQSATEFVVIDIVIAG
ncbi:MAG: hypothetical protein H7246_11815 [Phycisphaerae bacterium]|nr:hypothetical protein [Saprospiraceae bacterium]